MVRTYLTNFDRIIYEGVSLYDAMEAAEKAGFEATIYNDFDKTVMTYSPYESAAGTIRIGGWIIND